MCETDPSYLNGFQMEMVTWFPALYVSITVDNRAYFVFCNHVVPFRICPPVSITSVYDSVPQKYPFTQKCLFEGLVLFGNFSYFFRVLIVSNRIPATFLVLFSLNGFFFVDEYLGDVNEGFSNGWLSETLTTRISIFEIKNIPILFEDRHFFLKQSFMLFKLKMTSCDVIIFQNRQKNLFIKRFLKTVDLGGGCFNYHNRTANVMRSFELDLSTSKASSTWSSGFIFCILQKEFLFSFSFLIWWFWPIPLCTEVQNGGEWNLYVFQLKGTQPNLENS